jgi:hypothetical protein
MAPTAEEVESLFSPLGYEGIVSPRAVTRMIEEEKRVERVRKYRIYFDDLGREFMRSIHVVTSNPKLGRLFDYRLAGFSTDCNNQGLVSLNPVLARQEKAGVVRGILGGNKWRFLSTTGTGDNEGEVEVFQELGLRVKTEEHLIRFFENATPKELLERGVVYLATINPFSQKYEPSPDETLYNMVLGDFDQLDDDEIKRRTLSAKEALVRGGMEGILESKIGFF